MTTLYHIFQFAHYVICITLVIVVLMQAGKSGGMAGIFGGGGSDQIFNAPSGMSFMRKFTITLACIFIVTSLLLTKISTNMGVMSVMNQLSNLPVAAAPQEPVK